MVVAKMGSLTRAGEKLGLPKSTISRRVRRLEQELGLALLHRKGRTIRLTQQGEWLYQRCAPSLTELTEIETLLQEQKGAVTGLLQVKIPPMFSGFKPFSRLLSRFMLVHPGLQVHVLSTSRRVELIEEGLDISFRIHRGRLPDHTSLMTRRLMDTYGRLYASPGYIEEYGEPKSPEELIKHRCLTPRYQQPMKYWPMLHLATKKHRKVSIVPSFTSNEIRVLYEMTLAGTGVGLLPEFLVQEAQQKKELLHLLPGWAVDNGSISLVWPSTRYLAPRVRVFIDFMTEYFADSVKEHQAEDTTLDR